MAASDTATRKVAPPKGAAARAEKKAKTVDFLGLPLDLPAKLPGTILFDIADVEAGNDLRGTMKLIESILGPQQYQAIREKIAAENIGIDEVEEPLTKLVDDVLVEYGLAAGE